MDIEKQILYLGVIIGWLFTVLGIAIVGVIGGIGKIILIIMIGVSAGLIFSILLTFGMVCFLQNYKIVRR